jgi:CDP-diacylglycerol---glycerol-3-phosphate 3-phosphatidyltransferase
MPANRQLECRGGVGRKAFAVAVPASRRGSPDTGRNVTCRPYNPERIALQTIMASIYDLKPRFQALLRPVTGGLARRGVTANQVTLFAMGLSVAAGAAIALFPEARTILLVIPLLLFVRMALNAVDGMLAREHDMKTPLGAVLNELGDVVSDAALYLPLGLIAGVPAGLVTAAVVLAVISEMTGVVGVQIGASRRYDGPMGKSDRAFVFGLIALLLGLGVGPGPWLGILLVAVCGLLVVTILNRAAKALEEIKP